MKDVPYKLREFDEFTDLFLSVPLVAEPTVTVREARESKSYKSFQNLIKNHVGFEN